ncbi:MAG: hypothetical protein VR78_02300 [Hoeflea sp. BRH_c9]|nr:MAG: hypothetical protein VR78_02300 [Hoeflea sp. BRH_c9]MDP2734018.1 hypothetical protein [Hoeflea sp.]
MSGSIEWIAVKSFNSAPIGAIGFLDNKAVAIAAFYDDADANQDGKIAGFGERVAAMIGLKGRIIAEIAMEARVNPEIVRRDANFAQEAPRIWLSFAKGLVIQGVYQAYFARGVSMAGSGVAKKITTGMVKQLVVRKGFETVVKNAFMAMV